MTDVFTLLGRGAFFRAPFRNSISSAWRPTMRSNAAILASYSWSRSASARHRPGNACPRSWSPGRDFLALDVGDRLDFFLRIHVAQAHREQAKHASALQRTRQSSRGMSFDTPGSASVLARWVLVAENEVQREHAGLSPPGRKVLDFSLRCLRQQEGVDPPRKSLPRKKVQPICARWRVATPSYASRCSPGS